MSPLNILNFLSKNRRAKPLSRISLAFLAKKMSASRFPPLRS